jgi:hypothetical protein
MILVEMLEIPLSYNKQRTKYDLATIQDADEFISRSLVMVDLQ